MFTGRWEPSCLLSGPFRAPSTQFAFSFASYLAPTRSGCVMSCIGVTGLLRHTNRMLSADRYGGNTCCDTIHMRSSAGAEPVFTSCQFLTWPLLFCGMRRFNTVLKSPALVRVLRQMFLVRALQLRLDLPSLLLLFSLSYQNPLCICLLPPYVLHVMPST